MFWMLMLQVALIGLNAVFASAEIAVIQMNETKVEKMAREGNKPAQRLNKLIHNPARFLATIQVAITLSGFLGSAFAADNFSDSLVDWLVCLGVNVPVHILDTLAVIVITIILSYFTLVFGELVPKQVAMRKTQEIAFQVSGLITFISKIFKPLVSLLTVSTNFVVKLMGINPNDEDESISEEEIRLMVDAGSEKGTIDAEEREWIENVFDFDDLDIEEIMTHRKDLIMLDYNDNKEKWYETIQNCYHSLFPIYDENKDYIIGILQTKDYFRLKNHDKQTILDKAVKPPYFVSENQKADVIFRQMKAHKEKLAVVLDEYGGMSGIITMNDLVEELVGDLNDDEQKDYLSLIEKNVWQIHGNVSLDDIEKETGVHFKEEDINTLNGLIFEKLKRVPLENEVVEIRYKNLNIKVDEFKNHKVLSGMITLQENNA